MSSRQDLSETRTIHPSAVAEVGERVVLEMLGVARDLRSGAIPPEEFNQRHFCGTPCCIAGHVALRIAGRNRFEDVIGLFYNDTDNLKSVSLMRLFSGRYPSDPALAARAIERYVFWGSKDPWGD